MKEIEIKGHIPGPQEPDEVFYQRITQSLPNPYPSKRFTTLFHHQPDWIEVQFKNQGLRPWEGACAWIDTDKVILQLRKSLKKGRGIFNLYSTEEILAHEYVHAVRFKFEEPIFEEILAYRTSSSLFRRFFGPFFRSPKESLVVLSAITLFPLICFYSLSKAFYMLGTLLSLGIIRLCYYQWRFSKTHRRLNKLYPNISLAPMLYLTDQEIIEMSKNRDLKAYIDSKKESSLRWKQLTSLLEQFE